jgi:hypothetical protein
MVQLQTAGFGAARLGVTLPRFYQLIREKVVPPGVAVRTGRRQLRVDSIRLEQFIREGGYCPPSGRRQEGPEATV